MAGATKEELWELYKRLTNAQDTLRHIIGDVDNVYKRVHQIEDELEQLRRMLYDHYADERNPYATSEG